MISKKLGSFLFFLVMMSGLFAQKNYVYNHTYFDAEKWTEYRAGNMPLVITVPHGGNIKPDSIPDRDCKDAVVVTDSYTIEMANAIDSVFVTDYGFRPHIIISRIARKKVDQNREIELGTCGNIAMAKPWNSFHDFAEDALKSASDKFGKCLYIDLHAHGHPIQRLELGYLLKGDDLTTLQNTNDNNELGKKSSLNNLLQSKPNLNFKDLLTGPKAFGTWMAEDKFAAIPSQQDPYPSGSDPYFNGGYNTRRFTDAKHPNVFGWQIESNFKGVREYYNRPLFAKAFCKNVMRYLAEYTNIDIKIIGK